MAEAAQCAVSDLSGGLCSINLLKWDSSCESSVVAGVHEQTHTACLQDPELARVQRCAEAPGSRWKAKGNGQRRVSKQSGGLFARRWRKHGGTKRRVWRKIHIGIDEKTLEIRAAEFTTSDVGDAPFVGQTVPRTVC